MTDYSKCAACGALIDGVAFDDDGGYFGTGYEIAAQEFDQDGTVETRDAMHDGYLCAECATFMWLALLKHVEQKGDTPCPATP